MPQMSEAKKRANKKWNDANMKERYDRVQLVLPKGKKAELQAIAERNSQSVNGFINGLINEFIEQSAVGGSSGFTSAIQTGNSSSHSITFTAPSFQSSLSSSGQTAEEYIAQAVRERIERETAPTGQEWISSRPLARIRELSPKALDIIMHRLSKEERQAWDAEMTRELHEQREGDKRHKTGWFAEQPTCNLDFEAFEPKVVDAEEAEAYEPEDYDIDGPALDPDEEPF